MITKSASFKSAFIFFKNEVQFSQLIYSSWEIPRLRRHIYAINNKKWISEPNQFSAWIKMLLCKNLPYITEFKQIDCYTYYLSLIATSQIIRMILIMIKISSDSKKKVIKMVRCRFASSNVTTRDVLYCQAGGWIKAKLKYALEVKM